jgi:hypothetical protein
VSGQGLGQAVYAAGLDIRNRPSIHLESFLPAIGAAADFAPGSAAYYGQRVQLPNIAPLGQDRRWLWQALNPQTVDNTVTSVDDWTQNARTLTGTIERSLAASTSKATLDLSIEFANAPLKTLAVIIENVPTALLASQPAAMTWFNSEASFQIFKALDSHCYAAITAATPATQAWDTNILQTARMGIATMRAAGGAPTLWAMSPADHALIDTLQTSTGEFIATSSPEGSGTGTLWSLPVTEVPAVTGDMLLLEPARLGVLVVGGLNVLVDPYTKMSTNLVDVRFELNLLYHVRQIDAALSVADSAS